MAPADRSDPPAAGSAEDVARRLSLWGRDTRRGLSRVEYTSEVSRRRSMELLRGILDAAGVPFHEIDLPEGRPAIEVVDFLEDRLRGLDDGVVSIAGFEAAFPAETSGESLAALSVRREALAAFPLRQVWWLPRPLSYLLLAAAPDLHSWFLERLVLKEAASASGGDPGRARVDAEPDYLAQRADKALSSGPWTGEGAQLVGDALQALLHAGRSAEALQLGRRALAAMPGEPSDLAEAGMLASLAKVYWKTRHFEEAARLVQQVIDAADKLPDTDRFLPVALNNLGVLMLEQGRYDAAARLIQRGLELRRRKPESPDWTGIELLTNLGAALLGSGEYARSEEVLLEAQGLATGAAQGGSLAESEVSNTLSIVYLRMGRFAEAERSALRSLSLAERLLGPARPEVANRMNNLASIYEELGRWEEAGTFYRSALDVLEPLLGPDHPELAAPLAGLAGVRIHGNEFVDGEKLARKALEIHARSAGEEHPELAPILSKLGQAIRAQGGRPDEAESYLGQALKLAEQAHGSNHPDVAFCLHALAQLRRDQGRIAEAQAFAARAVAMLEGSLGKTHPTTRAIRQHHAGRLSSGGQT